MNLTLSSRPVSKKSDTKRWRREGKIPAIVYATGQASHSVLVDRQEFRKLVNSIEPGTLSSKIFTLDLDGQSVKAIIKEIQYSTTAYDVIHLDFERLQKDTPVTVNVPVQCINVNDCVGVKLGGGFLRQIVRHCKVICENPEAIPHVFEIDVRDLGLHQTKKLADIDMPSGIKPVSDLSTVVVLVAKR